MEEIQRQHNKVSELGEKLRVYAAAFGGPYTSSSGDDDTCLQPRSFETDFEWIRGAVHGDGSESEGVQIAKEAIDRGEAQGNVAFHHEPVWRYS